MSDVQSFYFKHISTLAETLQGLVNKSMAEDLSIADGRLYMHLCDLLTAHATLLEEQTRESIEKRRGNSGGDQKEDIEPEGDRPPDPES